MALWRQLCGAVAVPRRLWPAVESTSAATVLHTATSPVAVLVRCRGHDAEVTEQRSGVRPVRQEPTATVHHCGRATNRQLTTKSRYGGSASNDDSIHSEAALQCRRTAASPTQRQGDSIQVCLTQRPLLRRLRGEAVLPCLRAAGMAGGCAAMGVPAPSGRVQATRVAVQAEQRDELSSRPNRARVLPTAAATRRGQDRQPRHNRRDEGSS